MLKSKADFHLHCFGGFNFSASKSGEIDLETHKARALITYLAVEKPRSFRRRHLAGLLWSDSSEEKALHNLRQTLYQLNRTWMRFNPQEPLMIAVQDAIALNPKIGLWVDVLTFETAHARALGFFHQSDRMENIDIQQLLEAITLFTGPFLDRFRLNDTLLFNEWAAFQRERANQRAVEVMKLLITYHEQRGEHGLALSLAERMIALNPWDESAYALSMRLYAGCGQWEIASQKYHQLQKYLNENLSILPELSVTTLYQHIQQLALKQETLPPRLTIPKNNLPNPASSFIGRDFEISDISNMIANPKIRLITLLGLGGVGKTRLVTEIGHLFHGFFADGIVFITMKDVSSPDSLLHLIGLHLGLKFLDTPTLNNQILNYLRKKRCMLIFDGCEEEIIRPTIGQFINTVLEKAAMVMILTTSRERLNLRQEHVYPIKGLNFQSECGSSEAIQSLPEAAALFTDRVRQLNPKFDFTENDKLQVIDLCEHVEGHPLSIELLASATMTSSIHELLSGFMNNLPSLRSILLNATAEHASLSIVFNKSWQALSKDQKDALCRLTEFKGGFSKQAALSVSKSSEPVFSALVDKTIINNIDSDRFDLHEMVRQFALNKAAEKDLIQEIKNTHANYFRDLLEKLCEEYENGNQMGALDAIEIDKENFLQCWRFYIKQQAVQELHNCIEIMFHFFNIRSMFNEGAALFQETINSARYLNPFDPLIGVLDLRLASFALRLHQNERAYQLFQQSLAIFRESKNLINLGLTYQGLGEYFLKIKDYDRALEYAKSALDCFEELDDVLHQDRIHYFIGIIHQKAADYPLAKILLTEALALSRKANDQRGIFLNLNQLAGHACNEGDFVTAKEYYLESLSISRRFKDRYQEAIILNNLASIYHPTKEYQLEESVLRQSLEICREIGDQDGMAIALSNLGELAIVQGQFELAVQYCKEALDIALMLGEEWTLVVVYDILGCAYHGLDNTNTAHQCFDQAIRIAHKIKAWDLLTRCVVNHSEVFIREDQTEIAQQILTAALAHPSLLYEYRQKAENLLTSLGLKNSILTNEKMLHECLDRYYDLTGVVK